MHLAHHVYPLHHHRRLFTTITVALTLALAAPTVFAQCVTTSSCWMPPGVTCAYPAPGIVFYPGVPGVGVRNSVMSDPNVCVPLPPPAGPAINSFFDVFYEIEFTFDGGQTWPPASTTAPCQVQIQPPIPAGPGLQFNTEMLQLDLLGGSLQPGVRLRESPSRPSLGGTIRQPLGGGLYQIDSFFDIFTELSVDGGQTWHEASQPLHFTTIDRTPLPTRVSTWGTVKIRYR